MKHLLNYKSYSSEQSIFEDLIDNITDSTSDGDGTDGKSPAAHPSQVVTLDKDRLMPALQAIAQSGFKLVKGSGINIPSGNYLLIYCNGSSEAEASQGVKNQTDVQAKQMPGKNLSEMGIVYTRQKGNLFECVSIFKVQ